MKTLKNKLYASLLILEGVVATIVTEGDATALVLFSVIGVPMFFAKEPWIY